MGSAKSFRECFFTLMQSLAEPLRKTAAMLCWALWKRRNDLIWEGIVQLIEVVVSKTMDFLSEWKAARNSVSTWAAREDSVQAVEYYWRKPDVGSYKCNVDAAIFNTDNKYGVDMCIRTDMGEFYRGKTIWFMGEFYRGKTMVQDDTNTNTAWNANLLL